MNTMKAYRDLLEAGFEEKQGQVVISVIEESVQNQSATKLDLAKTEKRLDVKITEETKKLDAKIVGVEKRLDAKINQVQVNLIKWMITSMITMAGVIIAFLK